MAVITMSRQIGSGADQVANQLCADLDLVAFDKRLMVRVASEIGVSEDEIVDYSEDRYKLRGFFDALFRRARPVAEISSWTGGRSAGYERQIRVLDEDRAVDLVRAAVTAAYDRGNVLIIGRGSQAILEDKSDVLHVRVVAPFEDRVARIQSRESVSPAQARRLIAESDRATEEYLGSFHHIDVDDPSLYHMILNTGKLGIDKTVAMIKRGIEDVAAQLGEAA